MIGIAVMLHHGNGERGIGQRFVHCLFRRFGEHGFCCHFCLRRLQLLYYGNILGSHFGWCHSLGNKYFGSDCPQQRADRGCFNVSIVDHTAVHEFATFLVIKGIIITAVCGLYMEINGIIHKVQRFFTLNRWRFRYRLLGRLFRFFCGWSRFADSFSSTVNATFLADGIKMTVNVSNQRRGRFIDGFQTFPKDFQIFIL